MQSRFYKDMIVLPRITSGIFLVGSAVWTLTNHQDVDLEFILSDGFKASNLKKELDLSKMRLGKKEGENFTFFLENFQRLFQNGKVDYGSYKLLINKQFYSLHFVPLKIYKRVCLLNLLQTERTRTLREYRLFPKVKESIYIQKNFWGEPFIFQAMVTVKPEGFITQTPLAIMKKQKYYLGLLPDKYLSGKIVYSKDSEIFRLREKLIRQIKKRLNLENKRHKIPGASLLLLFSKYDRMSKGYKNKLATMFFRMIK